jgi:hypothetical protein
MPNVQLPDGTVATFPDDMPQDQIEGAIRSHLQAMQPAPSAPPTNLPGYVAGSGVVPPPETLGRGAALIGAGLGRGLATDVGLPGDIAELAGMGGYLPTSQQAVSGLQRMVPSLPTPQTPGERILEAGAQGAGGALPLGVLGAVPAAVGGGGGAALASAAGRAAIQGAAMGAGGEAGGQEFGPPGRAVGSLLGVLGGGAAAGAVGRAGSALAGTTNPTTAAYDALGIKPRLAGDLSGSGFLQGMQATALRAPGGEAARQALENAQDDFGGALENIAGPLGKSATLQDAGSALQQGARDWFGRWRTAQENAWDAVSNKVMQPQPSGIPMPGGPPVSMSGVDQELSRTQSMLPNAPELAGIMQDPVFARLQTALGKDVDPTGALPWQDARNLRTLVGEKLDQSLLSGDQSSAAWRRIYGQLSDSLGVTARYMGAGNEWANANQITSQGHNFVDNVLSRIIDSKNPAQTSIPPENAAAFALGGAPRGGSVLQQIRDQMPDAADELAAYKLRDMATAKPAYQNAEGDAISPGSYLTGYSRLSDAAKAALFNDPEVAAGARNLATVAGSMRDTWQKFGNPSGTAGALMHGAGAGVGGAVGAAEGARSGYEEGGIGGAIKGGLAGAIAGTVTGGVLPYATGQGASLLTTSRPALGLARYLAAPSALAVPRAAGWGGLIGGAAPQVVGGPLMPGEIPRQ